jgi:hypothetical protein
MSKKRFRIETTCPQCGCSAVSHLSDEEIKERYGDVPNVDMECSACMLKYSTPMKEACPEWDDQCKLKS